MEEIINPFSGFANYFVDKDGNELPPGNPLSGILPGELLQMEVEPLDTIKIFQEMLENHKPFNALPIEEDEED